MSPPFPFVCLAAALAMLVAGAPALRAQNLHWGGASGTPAAAGGGTWDANTTVSWRDNSPTGTPVKWTQNRTAIFTGAAGGTVAVGDSLAADAIVFEAGAGAFSFPISHPFTIGGAGISSESIASQTLSINQGILTFAGHASAAAGSQATRVKITADGQVIFNGTSTAGAVDLTSAGDVQFNENSSAGMATIASTGQISFTGSATAGSATITNDGLLSFAENATSGAAAITNHSQLSITGSAHAFTTAAISNNALGVIDVSGSTLATVTLGSLTNAADATLNLGATRLKVANVNLVDGNALSFHLGATGTGLLEITGSFLGNATAEQTSITINDTGGLQPGRIVPLLDWSAAATIHDVQSTDFRLEPLPGGFAGKLRIEGTRLLVEILP